MLTSIAYAAAGAPGTAPADGAGGLFASFVPLILMFVVFYFLLIRPQQKRAKQHKEMLSALKKGDYVITSGGLLGRIVEVNGDIFSIDLGETKVRVPRSYVSGTYDPKHMEKVAKESSSEK